MTGRSRTLGASPKREQRVSSHDDDILDFDFFEDDATRESPPTTRPGGGRPPAGGEGGGPRRPQLRAPHGITPLLRLVGLIAFAILLVVLLVVWGQGCSSDKKRSSYNDYMTAIGDIGSGSAKIGADLGELLTTPGLKQAELETKLGGLIQQQQQDVQQAQRLDVPGPLHPAHEHAIEALQLRVAGMQGLLDTFKATASSKDGTAAGSQLSTKARRLDAGDVVWTDLFRAPAMKVLQDEKLADVTVPQSVAVENVELYSTRSLTSIWQRVHGASTGGTPSGIHGTGLAYVNVTPASACAAGCTGNGQLSTSTEATINSSTSLGFEVGVKNTGENQEVQITVTLTIPRKGSTPIKKKATIDLIDVGATKSVTFKNLPEPPFGDKTSVQVSVEPVPGETNKTNNSAEYPVIFSLQ